MTDPAATIPPPKAAGVEVSEAAYEAVKERLLAMGLIRKGRGRGGAIALATGMEGASASQGAAAAPRKAKTGNGMAAEPSFQVGQPLTLPQLESFLWKSADILRGSMDTSEFKDYILWHALPQAPLRCL